MSYLRRGNIGWIRALMMTLVVTGATFSIGCQDVIATRTADLTDFDEFEHEPGGFAGGEPNSVSYLISRQSDDDYRLQISAYYASEDDAPLVDRRLTDSEIAAMEQLFESARLNISFGIPDALTAMLRWDNRVWPNGPVNGWLPITEWIEATEIREWLETLSAGVS
jgi:hypothetical protein